MLQFEIENHCRNLIGFPLNEIGRNSNMVWFGFGKSITTVNKRGDSFKSSEFVLHIQCTWRLIKENKIITASRDIYVPKSNWNSDNEFDWDIIGENRFDELLKDFLKKYCGKIYIILLNSDPLGGLRISFTDNISLEIFPDESTEEEFWRIFTPGKLDSHFVVTGLGIEK
ncbi:hypothetical protein [Bacillus sp. FJAT-52991]|uniref:Uncharacterized protein n=1 Tax=Bacillus kandeliae TaxID=3129297 RepID=A0ABZ2N4L1_9BACI